MSNEQIAHDLAVAKLYGSDLAVEELCKQYKENYAEILKCLKSVPVQKASTTFASKQSLFN